MDFLLLINPGARRAARIDTAALAAPWAAQGVTEVVVSKSRGQARQACAQAVSAGAKAVVIVGGDGSANNAAGRLLGSRSALAVIGAGTTNVIARSIGVPRDPVVASASLARGWADGGSQPVPVGRANDAIFLANAGVGFDAAVVRRVEASPNKKRLCGHVWFLAAALLESSAARQLDLSVSVVTRHGDRLGPAPTCFVAALRTGAYTFIGCRPLHLSPGSGLRPGLHGVWLTRPGRAALARVAATALTAKGPGNGFVTRVEDIEAIEISAAQPAPFQVDGDLVGHADQVRIDLHPEPLMLIRPG